MNAEMFNNALQQADSAQQAQVQYMLPRITGYIDFQQGT